MPIIKSAIKRVKTSETRRKRNLITRNRWKDAMKEIMDLIEAGKMKEAAKLMPNVQKQLDIAAKKNVLNKKTVDRKKSRLAKRLAPKKK